jgi:hypothetical protein
MPSPSDTLRHAYAQPLPEDPADRGPVVATDSGRSTQDAVIDQLPAGQDPRQRTAIRYVKRPGVSGSRGDYDKLLVLLEEQVRRERDTWTEAQIVAEAERRYADTTVEPHPKFVDEYVKVRQISYSSNRSLLRENIETAACRRVPELHAIEQVLRECAFGRPSGRELPVAVFLRSTLGAGRPDIRSNHEAFGGSDLELDWASLDSADMDVNRAKMRELSVVRKTLKAMLDRHDPALLLDANLQILRRLHDPHADDGYSDVGRYLVIDATDITAHVEQTVPVNDEHLRLIVKSTGARLKTGRKLTETTYPKRNARLYTYLPRGGDYVLYATRLALMRRRNSVEAVFSVLKHRGIGNKKHHKVRWATRAQHMRWAIGMALLGMTLRRDAHETGLYEQCAQDAWDAGLLKVRPPAPPHAAAA